MLREAHKTLGSALRRRDHGFRWRGDDVSRIEGLSDAVFGFAITLLVVSLEAPKRFEDLERLLHGFLSFGACFALLLHIWHAQYLYFRRYALDDGTTFVLNAALLFVVAFYVYPLKFLFSLFANAITHYQELDANGVAIQAMQPANWRPLMMIYSAGFVGVYVIFALLYRHAYRLHAALELSPMEVHETLGVLHEHLAMIAIGATAFVLAMLGHPGWSGFTYMLIAPLQTVLGKRHGMSRKRIVMSSESATVSDSPAAPAADRSASPSTSA